MKRNKLLLFAATILVSAFSVISADLTAVHAEGDKIPDAANYLRLGAEDTDVAWIGGHPIIFFNTNPAWEIASIQRINYEVKLDGKTQPTNGSIEYDDDFALSITRGSQSMFWKWLGNMSAVTIPYEMDTVRYAYSLDTATFSKTSEGTTTGLWATVNSPNYTVPTEQTVFNFYELGQIQMLKNLYNFIGEVDDDLATSVLKQYKTTKSGWTSVQNAFSHYGSNYEYFLILPFNSTNNVTITYLSLEATDIHGNIITDDPGIEELDPIDPDDPEEPTSYGFYIRKVSGNLTTHSAFYFPGSNVYRLIGVEMTGYADSDDVADYGVRLYCGNLIGQQTIDQIEDNLAFSIGLTNNVEKVASYLFNGDNNSILVDIPEEVTDCSIMVRYTKDTTVGGQLMDPFGMNLIDNNGNYGIQGELPIEEEPETGFDLWAWLAGIFGSSGSTSIKNILLGTAIVIVGLVIVYFVLVAIRFFATTIAAVRSAKR